MLQDYLRAIFFQNDKNPQQKRKLKIGMHFP